MSTDTSTSSGSFDPAMRRRLGGETPTVVRVGDTGVSVKRKGHTLALAKILGRTTKDGIESIYLDRLVHKDWETFEGWNASGAISTILSRTAVVPSPAN